MRRACGVGIDFAQAELATKIRGKYLRALEDEQFAVLPAQTYVKGFLRTYAEYLGLDGQLYVDEFNSRFVIGEEHEPRVTPLRGARPQRAHRRHRDERRARSRWRDRDPHRDRHLRLEGERRQADRRAAARRRRHGRRRPQVKPPLLEVTARRGQTHLIVHEGNATGNVVFDGTISKGDPAARDPRHAALGADRHAGEPPHPGPRQARPRAGRQPR